MVRPMEQALLFPVAVVDHADDAAHGLRPALSVEGAVAVILEPERSDAPPSTGSEAILNAEFHARIARLGSRAQKRIGAGLKMFGSDQELKIGAGADGLRGAYTQHRAGVLRPLDAIALDVPCIGRFLNRGHNPEEVERTRARGIGCAFRTPSSRFRVNGIAGRWHGTRFRCASTGLRPTGPKRARAGKP